MAFLCVSVVSQVQTTVFVTCSQRFHIERLTRISRGFLFALVFRSFRPADSFPISNQRPCLNYLQSFHARNHVRQRTSPRRLCAFNAESLMKPRPATRVIFTLNPV